jgi:hypothetical protein
MGNSIKNNNYIFLLELLNLLNLTSRFGRKYRIAIDLPPTNIRNLAVAPNVDYSEGLREVTVTSKMLS